MEWKNENEDRMKPMYKKWYDMRLQTINFIAGEIYYNDMENEKEPGKVQFINSCCKMSCDRITPLTPFFSTSLLSLRSIRSPTSFDGPHW